MVKYGVSILKKIIFLCLFIPLIAITSDLRTEQKIYKLIIHSLLPQKKEIKVWSDTPQNRAILNTIPDIIFVKSPRKADFLLLNHDNIPSVKGIIFVTDFKLLQKMHNSAVGGFFWQKGRPNILFLRKNLNKKDLTLPKSMQDYIEDTL